MNILIIGQCTLHWGRMEFGNIGNYYILEPLIRELHKTFPNSHIKTTFQLSERFCKDENISCVPMELYYDFNQNKLSEYLSELAAAQIYSKTGVLPLTTQYIEECINSDLVIDFSGDIWGDNANFLGKDRFLSGLIKDRIPQLLNKKTVMIAGSPGPFENQETLEFAKEVYENFDLVTNRESISKDILKNLGFNISKTHSFSCPAFLFEPLSVSDTRNLKINKILDNIDKPIVGFILCGWNFSKGPFDLWPRSDFEYNVFVETIEYISEKLGYHVLLISHSNGFPPPPNKFQLEHGRDYLVSEQVYNILKKRNIASNYSLVTDVLDAWETKTIIGKFDFLVSGRIHGAVAGLSQQVPTVIIDYGHEPKAHKLKGFAIEMGVEECIADPTLENDIINKINLINQNKQAYIEKLSKNIKLVKEKVLSNFEVLNQFKK